MLYSDMKLNYCMHISFNIGLIFYLYYFMGGLYYGTGYSSIETADG